MNNGLLNQQSGGGCRAVRGVQTGPALCGCRSGSLRWRSAKLLGILRVPVAGMIKVLVLVVY